MKKFFLLDYVTDYIEDEYAMEVLFNVMKQTVAANNFHLKDIQCFQIDGRFLGEDISVFVRTQYKTTMHIMALLLSIRVLMINKKSINNCEDDFLLFPPATRERFEWVGFVDIIMNCMDDNEFAMLYELLESEYFDEELTAEQEKKFCDSIVIPEFRNIKLYYHNKAARKTAVHIIDDVICNNAFVGAKITSYEVKEDIAYVGDTAFAYCDSLKELRFEGKVLFGKFPIIECPSLQHIVVQEEYDDYYKESLPYYKDIVITEEQLKETESVKEQVIEATNTNVSARQTDMDYSIDTDSLELVFDKIVNSHKFFWWLSIISLVKERNLLCIPFKDILIRMASLAWPLIFNEEFYFGDKDMMAKYLNVIHDRTMLVKSFSTETIESYLNRHYTEYGINEILSPLLKNVPYRFLSPLINFTTNEEVAEKSKESDYGGPYAINLNNILLNEQWRDYLNAHYYEQCLFTIRPFIDYAAQYCNNDNKLKNLLKLMQPLEKYGKIEIKQR